MTLDVPTIDADALAAERGFAPPPDYNAARLLWDNLPGNADRVAVIHGEDRITYGDLAAEAARIGNHLRAEGAEPGDRVLLVLDDEPAYPAAIMGLMRAGLVPILVNVMSPPDLLRFLLEDSGAVATIESRAHVDQMAAALEQRPVRRHHADLRPWRDAPATLAEHPTGPDDAAFLHLSGPDQAQETARRHYGKELALLALAIPEGAVPGLRWEESRDGQPFPHAYEDVPVGAVDHALRLTRGMGASYMVVARLAP